MTLNTPFCSVIDPPVFGNFRGFFKEFSKRVENEGAMCYNAIAIIT